MTKTRLYHTVGILLLVITIATIWVYTTVTRTYVSDTKSISSPPYSKAVPRNTDTRLAIYTADLKNPGSPPDELYTPAELKLIKPNRSMLQKIYLLTDIDRLLWDLEANTSAKV